MKLSVIFVFLFFCLDVSVAGQGMAFGPKGGLSIAQQNYSGYQRDPLVTFHAALYVETLSEANVNALYAQIGYHVRGSSLHIPRYTNSNGQDISARTQKSKFGNLALLLGGKQKFDLGLNSKWYFGFAIRGEYNLSVELPSIYEPLEDEVKPFVYGVTASVGTEFMLNEHAGVVLELNVHPDLSDQIIIPAQRSVSNPNRIITERRVRNVSVELTVGLRLLRKVIYID